ncbi:hypothetical protein FNYG_14824 [Fusarium nygamai]|uniref:Uncharacterized protein n=1 Tax=Gibberella nygamai TaxID=42673 RepID=A0A2K0UPY8_GIBNY|nr:hypothetical protein FNYG_14824 [Fusarium nygamai]
MIKTKMAKALIINDKKQGALLPRNDLIVNKILNF